MLSKYYYKVQVPCKCVIVICLSAALALPVLRRQHVKAYGVGLTFQTFAPQAFFGKCDDLFGHDLLQRMRVELLGVLV